MIVDRQIISAPDFYTRMAPTYEDHFAVPHRKAYDTLCWEAVSESLGSSSVVVDVGCGIGRWARALVAAGHRVVGIEPSAGMALRARELQLGDRFELQEVDVDGARVDPGSADVVLAMGSIQYAPDPARSIKSMAEWLRPGGRLWVLVDSQMALVEELLRSGDIDQAIQRASDPVGWFALDGQAVRHHLFTASAISADLASAGLVGVRARGLLVGWSSKQREEALSELVDDWEGCLARERRLSHEPALADHGKQILVSGTRG